MIKMHEEMMAEMKAGPAKLDQLVQKMDAAPLSSPRKYAVLVARLVGGKVGQPISPREVGAPMAFHDGNRWAETLWMTLPEQK